VTVRHKFRIVYKERTKNTKADALSKRSNFISKKDKKETLLRLRKDSLKYSSKVAVVYKVIKDLAIKQQIQNIYKGDTKAKITKT
jgi:Integrase zinc binding domain